MGQKRMSYMLNHRSGASREAGQARSFASEGRSDGRISDTSLPVFQAGASAADDEALNRMAGEMPVQVAVVDAEWRILSTNAAWDESALRHASGALFCEAPSVRSSGALRLMEGSKAADAVLGAMQAIDDGDPTEFVHAYRSRDDEQVQISIVPFRIGGARFATVSRLNMSVLMQLRRERVQLSARLMRAQSRLMCAQEDERKRVARDLHDSAAQYLVGIGLGLANIRQVTDDPPVTALVDELSGLLDQFHRELRGLAYVLHPPQLENCGLHAAIESLCNGIATRAGIEISLRIYGVDRRHGSTVEGAVYRIVQEALSNVHRHAHASHVRVRLSNRADALFVVVEDDGIGLPGSREGADDIVMLGVGIPGMIARISELGGRFVIRGHRRGKGTVLGAVIPRHGLGQAFLVGEVAALRRRAAEDQ
jgi:signal transduction histidine kinase